MNRLAAMLAVLAAPPARQLALLAGLPVDRGATDYESNFERNPLLILVLGFLENYNDRDYETLDEFLARLGLPAQYRPVDTSIDKLVYVLFTLKPANSGLWNRKALERKTEWRLVRRLAAVVLAENGWQAGAALGDAETVLRDLGAALRTTWRDEGRTW